MNHIWILVMFKLCICFFFNWIHVFIFIFLKNLIFDKIKWMVFARKMFFKNFRVNMQVFRLHYCLIDTIPSNKFERYIVVLVNIHMIKNIILWIVSFKDFKNLTFHMNIESKYINDKFVSKNIKRNWENYNFAGFSNVIILANISLRDVNFSPLSVLTMCFEEIK